MLVIAKGVDGRGECEGLDFSIEILLFSYLGDIAWGSCKGQWLDVGPLSFSTKCNVCNC